MSELKSLERESKHERPTGQIARSMSLEISEHVRRQRARDVRQQLVLDLTLSPREVKESTRLSVALWLRQRVLSKAEREKNEALRQAMLLWGQFLDPAADQLGPRFSCLSVIPRDAWVKLSKRGVPLPLEVEFLREQNKLNGAEAEQERAFEPSEEGRNGSCSKEFQKKPAVEDEAVAPSLYRTDVSSTNDLDALLNGRAWEGWELHGSPVPYRYAPVAGECKAAWSSRVDEWLVVFRRVV